MATTQKKFGLSSVKAFYTIIITAVKALIATAVAEVKAAFGSALEYKGSVPDYDSLPKSGQQKGDTYNVVAAHGNTPAGTNYAWDGEKWDPLGGDIDLSGLATKTELQSAQEELEESLGEKLDASTYETEKANFLTEDDLEDYVKNDDLASDDEDGLMSKEMYKKVDEMTPDEYLTEGDFEEYTDTEIKEALKGLDEE